MYTLANERKCNSVFDAWAIFVCERMLRSRMYYMKLTERVQTERLQNIIEVEMQGNNETTV